jgi:threonine aldolase
MAVSMHFFSDNAASVHPRVWAAMQAADAPDFPYDADALSRALDEAFSALFGTPCAGLWVATGTAANCLALSAMVPPHGAVVCHREAHIEMDEGGAPGFFLHGAKLILAQGEGALLTPKALPPRSIRSAPACTRCSRMPSRSPRPANMAAPIARTRWPRSARWRARAGWPAHGRRALCQCRGVPRLRSRRAHRAGRGRCAELRLRQERRAGAEAIVLFDEELAETIRFRRKRAGHLQSKGRYLAAQILAMLEHDLWLANARAANAAAQELAGACAGRLLHAVEANELFVTLDDVERPRCAAWASISMTGPPRRHAGRGAAGHGVEQRSGPCAAALARAIRNL